MNFGHSCETSREIFAYPYPGRSAKISSGRGLPGQRISKKLMLRVRPGVELVRASFVPTNELMTLDLPTFDRPRKATSGTEGDGKCVTSVAAARNRARTLILKFAMPRWNLARRRSGLVRHRYRRGVPAGLCVGLRPQYRVHSIKTWGEPTMSVAEQRHKGGT